MFKWVKGGERYPVVEISLLLLSLKLKSSLDSVSCRVFGFLMAYPVS